MHVQQPQQVRVVQALPEADLFMYHLDSGLSPGLFDLLDGHVHVGLYEDPALDSAERPVADRLGPELVSVMELAELRLQLLLPVSSPQPKLLCQ